MKNMRFYVFELRFPVAPFISLGISSDRKITDLGQEYYIHDLVQAANETVTASGHKIDHYENVLFLAGVAHIINGLCQPAPLAPLAP